MDVNLGDLSAAPFEPLLLRGDWYLQHTTRAIWHAKRNVQAEGSYYMESLPSETLTYSYQEQDSPEVKSHVEKDWRVLGRGKDGRLEGWMKETEFGIEDTAGEIRADWRSSWMVIYFPPTTAPPTPAGIDILCNREKRLADETVEAIKFAIGKPSSATRELGKLNMFQMFDDGSRDEERREKRKAEHKRWVKRTGPEAGISPDLIYDDEEPKHSKCIVQ